MAGKVPLHICQLKREGRHRAITFNCDRIFAFCTELPVRQDLTPILLLLLLFSESSVSSWCYQNDLNGESIAGMKSMTLSTANSNNFARNIFLRYVNSSKMVTLDFIHRCNFRCAKESVSDMFSYLNYQTQISVRWVVLHSSIPCL